MASFHESLVRPRHWITRSLFGECPRAAYQARAAQCYDAIAARRTTDPAALEHLNRAVGVNAQWAIYNMTALDGWWRECVTHDV